MYFRHRVDELKERLRTECAKVDHVVVIAAAIRQWCRRLSACVKAGGGHFEHRLRLSDFRHYSVISGFLVADVDDMSSYAVFVEIEDATVWRPYRTNVCVVTGFDNHHPVTFQSSVL